MATWQQIVWGLSEAIESLEVEKSRFHLVFQLYWTEVELQRVDMQVIVILILLQCVRKYCWFV